MNQKGLSLLESILGMGLLVVAALFSMQVMDNINTATRQGNAALDMESLKTRVGIVLKNPDHLNLTAIKITESAPFTKIGLDEPNKDLNNDGDPDEGREIMLYTADADGNQLGDPVFQAGDTMGALEINSIRLFMPSDIGGTNYPAASGHSDMGLIRFYITKKINKNTERDQFLDFSIGLTMDTDGLGNTTVVGGSLPNIAATPEEICESLGYFWNENDNVAPCRKHPHDLHWCSMEIIHYDHNHNTPELRVTMLLDANNQGWYGLNMTGDVGDDDSISFRLNCTSANPTGSYMRRCEMRFGQRDGYSLNDWREQKPRWELVARGNNIMRKVDFTGDVNSDDAFYAAMRCPMATLPTDIKYFNYFRRNCRFCIGISNAIRPQVESYSCAHVTNNDVSNNIDYAIVRIANSDMDGDDTLFFGFSCRDGEMTVRRNGF